MMRNARSTSATGTDRISAITSGDSRRVMFCLRSPSAMGGRPRRGLSPDIAAGRDVVKIAVEADDGEKILDLAARDQGDVVVVGRGLLGEIRLNPGEPRSLKAVMAVQNNAVGLAVDLELGRNGNVEVFGCQLGGNDIVVKVALAADGDGHAVSPCVGLLLQQVIWFCKDYFAGAKNKSGGIG